MAVDAVAARPDPVEARRRWRQARAVSSHPAQACESSIRHVHVSVLVLGQDARTTLQNALMTDDPATTRGRSIQLIPTNPRRAAGGPGRT
jgi:hypothetical protein